ncbi:MAG: roadblock/LC7 domain-containing protein [Candidatus Ranarchaeia archaeon]
MIDIKQIDDVLMEIIKGETGIHKIILVDRTGLTISDVSKYSYYPVDVAGIGAIASAVFCASEEQGKSLNIGNLTLLSSEFDEGKIFASSAGDGILCVVTDKSVNIGMIRFLIMKASRKLKKILEELLAPVRESSTTKDGEASYTTALNELEK